MENKEKRFELISREIIKFFVDNAVSYNEASEIMYYIKRKLGEQLVRDH